MQLSRARYENEIIALSNVECEIDHELLLYAGTNFFAVYQGVDDKNFQEIIASYYSRNCANLNFVSPNIGQVSKGRIKIGFVSENYFNHTVGKLFRGLIANLNRINFEVTVFSSRQPTDEIGNFIKEHCDHFVKLAYKLDAAREVISERKLDILFFTDIGMGAFTYFLAFSRLATVQCVGWGHGVTTGIPTIDYFISHTHLEEPDAELAQSHYTEKLVRLKLPPTYLYKPVCNLSRATLDLSFFDNRTVYCCGQSLHKIHPNFDKLLVEILKLDANGIGVFIEMMPGWSDILLKRWSRLDSNISEKIVFLSHLDQNSFFALIARSDVILDTTYFCGGISSVEALSFSKPIVTWPNTPLLCSQVTAAYYRQIGVLDCIANSAEDYVNIAVKLGTNLDWRRQIENRIRNQNHLLFKRSEVIAEYESFFESALGSVSYAPKNVWQ